MFTVHKTGFSQIFVCFAQPNSCKKKRLKLSKSKKTDTDKVTARSEKRLLMRLLFKELNKFLGRKKYFDNVQSNRE